MGNDYFYCTLFRFSSLHILHGISVSMVVDVLLMETATLIELYFYFGQMFFFNTCPKKNIRLLGNCLRAKKTPNHEGQRNLLVFFNTCPKNKNIRLLGNCLRAKKNTKPNQSEIAVFPLFWAYITPTQHTQTKKNQRVCVTSYCLFIVQNMKIFFSHFIFFQF